jgi:hypothetical protein
VGFGEMLVMAFQQGAGREADSGTRRRPGLRPGRAVPGGAAGLRGQRATPPRRREQDLSLILVIAPVGLEVRRRLVPSAASLPTPHPLCATQEGRLKQAPAEQPVEQLDIPAALRDAMAAYQESASATEQVRRHTGSHRSGTKQRGFLHERGRYLSAQCMLASIGVGRSEGPWELLLSSLLPTRS